MVYHLLLSWCWISSSPLWQVQTCMSSSPVWTLRFIHLREAQCFFFAEHCGICAVSNQRFLKTLNGFLELFLCVASLCCSASQGPATSSFPKFQDLSPHTSIMPISLWISLLLLQSTISLQAKNQSGFPCLGDRSSALTVVQHLKIVISYILSGLSVYHR